MESAIKVFRSNATKMSERTYLATQGIIAAASGAGALLEGSMAVQCFRNDNPVYGVVCATISAGWLAYGSTFVVYRELARRESTLDHVAVMSGSITNPHAAKEATTVLAKLRRSK